MKKKTEIEKKAELITGISVCNCLLEGRSPSRKAVKDAIKELTNKLKREAK